MTIWVTLVSSKTLTLLFFSQTIVSSLQRFAEKQYSYRNCWSMTMRERKVCSIEIKWHSPYNSVFSAHQVLHLHIHCKYYVAHDNEQTSDWLGASLCVQVSALTWMMSINGLEWRIQRSWSQRQETPALDSRCLSRYVHLCLNSYSMSIICSTSITEHIVTRNIFPKKELTDSIID